MIFKTMKIEEIRKALKGHSDILKSTYEDVVKFFKTLSCPRCHSEVMAIVNSRAPFRDGSIVPNYFAKCKVCGIEFEPYTGIIITLTDS